MALTPDARFGLAGTGYYVYDKGKPLIKDGKYVYQDISLRMFDIRRSQGIQERKDLAAPIKEKVKAFVLAYGTSGNDVARQQEIMKGLVWSGFRPSTTRS